MRNFNRLPLVLLFLSLAFATRAQKSGDNYELLLKNGAQSVLSNINEFSKEYNSRYVDQFEGRLYLVLQFQEIPGEDAKRTMKQAGIELLSYLPQNAYYASLPADLDPVRLQESGVRAVLRPDAAFKFAPSLYSAKFPQHATLGNTIELYVTFHEDVDRHKAIAAMGNGFEFVDTESHPGHIRIRSHFNDLPWLASFPFVAYAEPVPPAPTKDDFEGRSLHRSNAINTDFPGGRKYDGSGVVIGLADDGIIGPHIDYTGRLTDYATSNNGSHGDMTAGILFGAGNRDPIIRGHATGAYLHYWSIGGYPQVTQAVANLNNFGLVITSTSYSQGSGGQYTTDTQTIDGQIATNPVLVHVFSAGNAGNSNHNVWVSGWGNITGGYKAGKNVITCGNLNDSDVLEASSSRGPTADGRIKPDICANGAGQLSTAGPNTNQVGGGTSAAAPSIAGQVTQLYHAYKTLNSGNNPESGLIKGAVLNTAEDLGNPGPDYQHGWGRINSLRAVRTLENNLYLSSTVSNNGSNTHNLTVPAGTQQMRVMLYWMDPAGNPSASQSLVNNLRLQVTAPNSTTYNPWILSQTNSAAALNTNATRGIDNINNMEQVTLDAPSSGSYTVTVSGASVPSGPQKYYLLWYFINDDVEVTYPIGGEGFVPGESEKIRWDAYGSNGNFTLDYSTNGGTTWNLISSSVGGTARQFSWTVPNNVSGNALLRVTRGGNSDMSDDPFSIIGVPTGLTVDWVCPDSLQLSWNAVSGAVEYEASMLGAQYMDSVGTTTGTSIVITGTNPNTDKWLSVRAKAVTARKGRRAIAINQGPGTFACQLAVDAELNSIVSPGNGTLQSCQTSATSPVTINVNNPGLTSLSNLPVHFQLNANPVVNETITGPIAPAANTNFTFANTINLSTPGAYTLTVWITYPNDGNPYNDTLVNNMTIINGNAVNLPLTENFETMSNCGTANNCGGTTCNLGNGWVNVTNGSGDDIDWRVDDGGTASQNTGPSVDHDPGTAAGNYVYLEASGSCNLAEAQMISPCVNLVNANGPQLEFWYHMFGSTMGVLHVDIYANGGWINDVITPISGNQGNQWLSANVNLSAYSGGIINVRFRGVTGTNYFSDLALDDIRITTASAAPAAEFSADRTDGCVNATVNFSDLSTNAPTFWNWSFSPNTVNYVNSTSATSQNPSVQFTAPGTYTVTLQAGNTFGNDTEVKTAYIVIGSSNIPLVEDFQNAAFPPSRWSIDDPGGSNTWVEFTNIPGATGANTTVAGVENYVYNSPGAEDGMLTLPISVPANSNPYMTFDVAYAGFSATLFDGLRVDISTDCGNTFTPTAYLKSGPALATVANQNTNWAPSGAADWRNDTVDLSQWAGNDVIISFVNINGYGNNLYVDNINVQGVTGVAPASSYVYSGAGCTNQSMTFTSTATGTINTYAWNFGAGASPATANTAGPHNVTYSSGGSKTVTLTVTNQFGSDVSSQTFTVNPTVTPTVSIAQTGGNNPACVGDNLTYTATGSGGGTTPTYVWKVNGGQVQTGASPTYSSSALNSGDIVSCDLTSSEACAQPTTTNSNSITMTIAAQPAASFTFSAGGNGGDYTFNDGSSGTPSSWSWDFGDSNNSTQQNPSHTYGSSGTYVVTLTVTNACGTSTITDTVTVTIIGLENGLAGSSVEVFPNPSEDIFTLRLNLEERMDLNWTITDLRGRILRSGEMQQALQAQEQLDLSMYAKGMYFLKLKGKDAERTIKLILK